MRFFKKYLHDGDLERYRESGREYPHKDIPGRVLFLRKNGGLGKERTARRVEAPALRQRIGRFGADIGAVEEAEEFIANVASWLRLKENRTVRASPARRDTRQMPMSSCTGRTMEATTSRP